MTVRGERERAGLTQEQLHVASGVPLRTIQYWEREGVMNAKVGAVAAVARACGCTIDRLAGLTDDPTPSRQFKRVG